MRWLVALLLTLVPVGAPYAAWAQTAVDTLPERVVSQAYDAFNRRDPAAFLSFFAPVWYYTALEDTGAAPRRHVREDAADGRAFSPRASTSTAICCGSTIRTGRNGTAHSSQLA